MVRRLLGQSRAVLASPRPTDERDYKAVWNRLAAAGASDAIFTGATSEAFEASGEFDAALVGRYLHGDEVVLNIGCGVGRADRYLAPRVRELWAVDVSGEMIRRARERLADLPNVFLREVGNREFLSAFEAGRFDLVFSFLVLQHLEREDAILYLRDAARVLRSEGLLVTQFPDYLSPVYTRAFLDGVDAYPRSPGRVRPYTEAEVRHTLGLAGFAIEELWRGGHPDPDSEIYVVARKRAPVQPLPAVLR